MLFKDLGVRKDLFGHGVIKMFDYDKLKYKVN